MTDQNHSSMVSIRVDDEIYKRIVELAADLIYILDKNLCIEYLNQHSMVIFSKLAIVDHPKGKTVAGLDIYEPQTFIGHHLDELFRPSDVEFVRRNISRVLTSRKSRSYDHSTTISDRKIFFSTKLIPIIDSHGQVDLILGITRDVTKIREMDQRIYHTEKLASIGTLAAGVAHEINNPLAVILGFTDLLKEKFSPDSREYADLEMIEFNGNYAKKIVEDLLRFARITEGMEDYIHIAHCIDTVVKIVDITLKKQNVELLIDIPENLSLVKGDVREFQQVIFNLINNSIAAMSRTGGTLSIDALEDDGWVHISLTDTGVGIPERIKPNIFDPFFTTKKVGEGTGLGLSLCHGIVRKYGGRIDFISVSKEDYPRRPSGTRFTVSMKVCSSSELT